MDEKEREDHFEVESVDGDVEVAKLIGRTTNSRIYWKKRRREK